MNFIQRATLGTVGGLDFSVKQIGNQVPLAEYYRDGLPILQEYSIRLALEKDIKRNPFLYSALRKKADAIASVPFYVEEFRGDKWQRVENHPAENLIENANPFMSGFELKKQLVYHKELAGTAFMQIVVVDGKPQFLQPLFPQFMRVVPSAADFLSHFEYTISKGPPKKLNPREVLWTKHADPADPYRGLSPLQAIAAEMQTDTEARKWNRISLANRGASDVAFIMRNVVTEEDYATVRAMIEDRITGPDNARRPWVLGGDSDVRPMSYTAVEMDYINTRKFNREVISAALGVPAPLIGDADNSTYNNLDTLKRDFWQDTISHWLEELRQDMTRQILIPYYGDGRRTRAPRLRFMYDLSNVEALQVNMQEKANVAKTFVDAGYDAASVANLLELQLEVAEVPEPPAPVVGGEEEEPAGVDEEKVVRMAELAHAKMSDDQLFVKAIQQIHIRLAEAHGSRVDLIQAKARANEYVFENYTPRMIAEGELSACRR